jgi:hypothetical protein
MPIDPSWPEGEGVHSCPRRSGNDEAPHGALEVEAKKEGTKEG